MSVATRTLTGPRWSSAVTCPRRAVYQGIDAPTNPPAGSGDQLERWRRRGNVIGDAVRDDLITEYRKEGRAPRGEVEIPWPAASPIGTGHCDIWISHERTVVEIKTRVGAVLDESAALQVAGYAVNHPAAEKAYVLSVDPSSFQERLYPIDVAGLEARVSEIEQVVVNGVQSGELPERVCRHPGDGPAMFCDHSTHCFADWQAPMIDVLIGLDTEATTLMDAEDTVREAKQAVKEAEAERDAARAQLRPSLTPGVKVQIGEYDITITEVPPRETFSLSDLAKAGHELPTDLLPFVKLGTTHERWYLRRVPS